MKGPRSDCWVTYALEDKDVPKALVLASSLKWAVTRKNIGVIASDKVSTELRALLSQTFDYMFIIEDDRNVAGVKNEDFVKLYCMTLLGFHTCVFISPDMMMVRNSDELFELKNEKRQNLVCSRDDDTSLLVFRPSVNLFKGIIKSLKGRIEQSSNNNKSAMSNQNPSDNSHYWHTEVDNGGLPGAGHQAVYYPESVPQLGSVPQPTMEHQSQLPQLDSFSMQSLQATVTQENQAIMDVGLATVYQSEIPQQTVDTGMQIIQTDSTYQTHLNHPEQVQQIHTLQQEAAGVNPHQQVEGSGFVSQEQNQHYSQSQPNPTYQNVQQNQDYSLLQQNPSNVPVAARPNQNFTSSHHNSRYPSIQQNLNHQSSQTNQNYLPTQSNYSPRPSLSVLSQQHNQAFPGFQGGLQPTLKPGVQYSAIGGYNSNQYTEEQQYQLRNTGNFSHPHQAYSDEQYYGSGSGYNSYTSGHFYHDQNLIPGQSGYHENYHGKMNCKYYGNNGQNSSENYSGEKHEKAINKSASKRSGNKDHSDSDGDKDKKRSSKRPGNKKKSGSDDDKDRKRSSKHSGKKDQSDSDDDKEIRKKSPKQTRGTGKKIVSGKKGHSSSDDESKRKSSKSSNNGRKLSRRQPIDVVDSLRDLQVLGNWTKLNEKDPVHKTIKTYVRRSSEVDRDRIQIHAIYEIESTTGGSKSSVSKSSRKLLFWKTTPGSVRGLSGKKDGIIAFYDRSFRAFPVKPNELDEPLRQMMVLCKVNLGKSTISQHGYSHWAKTTFPGGHDSVIGVGSNIPDPEGDLLDGSTIVPCGKTMENTKYKRFEQEYNEYIVCESRKVTVRYAVDVEIFPEEERAEESD